MVRKGSPVRVRQRALQKPAANGGFRHLRRGRVAGCIGRYGSVLEAVGSECGCRRALRTVALDLSSDLSACCQPLGAPETLRGAPSTGPAGGSVVIRLDERRPRRARPRARPPQRGTPSSRPSAVRRCVPTAERESAAPLAWPASSLGFVGKALARHGDREQGRACRRRSPPTPGSDRSCDAATGARAGAVVAAAAVGVGVGVVRFGGPRLPVDRLERETTRTTSAVVKTITVISSPVFTAASVIIMVRC
jgi:hypothetical protein